MTVFWLWIVLASCKGDEETDTTSTSLETPVTDTDTDADSDSDADSDTDSDTTSTDTDTTPVDTVDDDGDGYSEAEGDCDDGDPDVHYGVAEICDEVDQDCDSVIDEGVMMTYYADADGDGFGDPSVSVDACTAPAGFVANGTDCDDADEIVYPGAPETCGGTVDANCDGSLPNVDADGDAWPSCAECDDTDASAYPGATEVCDEADNDCDGTVDEGVMTTYYADADGDGFGDPSVSVDACTAPTGFVAKSTDCNDVDATINPGVDERCDELDVDEDCNGLADAADTNVDESTMVLWCADDDGDGYLGRADCAACDGCPSTSHVWVVGPTTDSNKDGEVGCDDGSQDDDDSDPSVH